MVLLLTGDLSSCCVLEFLRFLIRSACVRNLGCVYLWFDCLVLCVLDCLLMFGVAGLF